MMVAGGGSSTAASFNSAALTFADGYRNVFLFTRSIWPHVATMSSFCRDATWPPTKVPRKLFHTKGRENSGNCARFVPLLGRNDSVGLGGTANLAVLGGNLPPSLERRRRSPFGAA